MSFVKDRAGSQAASAPPKPGGKLEAQQGLGRRILFQEDKSEAAPIAKSPIKPKVKIAGVKPASELLPIAAPTPTPPKGGRPKKIEGEPWKAAGLSRSQWFRRKAAGKL